MTETAIERVRVALAGERARFQALFFVHYAAFSGFVVFRNVYLEEMGMSGSAMGQVGFLMTATGVAVQPVWGVVTDHLRAERPVLVLGAVGSALGLLAYPAADGLAAPFALVAAGTVVYAAFHAPIVPIANGLVLSRGYDYGNVRAFGSVAFGIGSLGFGFVVAALGTASVVYFYVGGMLVLVAVVRSVSEREANSGNGGTGSVPDSDGVSTPESDGVSTPESEGESASDSDGEPDLSDAVRALVTNADFLVVLAIGFLVGLATRGGSAFFSVYMRAVDAGVVVGPWSLSADAVTGVAWALKTAFEAVAFVYAVKLSWSYRSFLVVGGAAVTLPNLVYGLTAQPWAIVAVQAAGGLGYALYYVAVVDLVYVVAGERVTATAQTVLTGVGIGFGGAVGQVVAGELTDLVGVQEMYLYLALVGFVGASVALLVRQNGSVGTRDSPV